MVLAYHRRDGWMTSDKQPVTLVLLAKSRQLWKQKEDTTSSSERTRATKKKKMLCGQPICCLLLCASIVCVRIVSISIIAVILYSSFLLTVSYLPKVNKRHMYILVLVPFLLYCVNLIKSSTSCCKSNFVPRI